MLNDYTFDELVLVLEAYNEMHKYTDPEDEEIYVDAEKW